MDTNLALDAVPGSHDDAAAAAARARLLAAAPRDGVVQRVVALAADHLGQNAPPRVYEPVAYLKTTQYQKKYGIQSSQPCSFKGCRELALGDKAAIEYSST